VSLPEARGVGLWRRALRMSRPPRPPMPLVSVVMPVRNEADHIAQSLRSVLDQTYDPSRLEVFVVDGMSSDDTVTRVRDVLESRATDLAARSTVEVLPNPARSAPAALNIGLLKAGGEIVVRVDGHCEVPPDFIERLVELLDEKDAQCVGGSLRTIGKGPVGRAIALAGSSRFGVGGAAFRTSNKGAYVDTVAFGAYPRDVFDRIGKFDEELLRNQDDEFNYRLTQAGGRIWLEPSLEVKYYSRATLPSLWRQYWQYGVYKIRVFQKRRGVPAPRQLAPAILVTSLACASVLSLVRRSSRPLQLVLVPYLVATAAATVETGRRDPALSPLLPLAFWTLHFSYGSGCLWGLWKWRKHARP
jgi:succinoglycan biosynthesis protein ExoA